MGKKGDDGRGRKGVLMVRKWVKKEDVREPFFGIFGMKIYYKLM